MNSIFDRVSRIAFVGAFSAVVVFAPSLSAYRREYNVTHEGRTEPGSEVCVYRGTNTDAFTSFFSDAAPTCRPAETVLDFPPGLFNAFARNLDKGYVSAHRDFFLYSPPPKPEQGYERLETPLEKAAYIDFGEIVSSLRDGQSLGVWLAPSPTTLGTYFPLVAGEHEVMIPEQTLAIPLLIEDHLPKTVGEIVVLKASQHEKARFRQGDERVLVAWVKLDRTVAGIDFGRTPLPDVVFISHGQTIKSLAPPIVGDPSYTILFFRGVPAGTGELRVRGATWRSTVVPIEIDTRGTTVVRQGVPLIPAGALRVSLGLPTTFFENPVDECPVVVDAVTVLISLLHCPGSGDCTEVATRAAPFARREPLEFAGLDEGHYRVVLKPPMTKSLASEIDIRAGRVTTTVLPIETFNFYGRVTVNGVPSAAKLLFATGEARADSSGDFLATLAADPLSNIIHVETCVGARHLRFVPRERIIPNVRYDITIDARALTVRVRNNRGAPISSATVFFGTVKTKENEEPSMSYTSSRIESDAEGNVDLSEVPGNDLVVICAHHQAYVDRCTDPVRLSELRDSAVTVQLRDASMNGHVVGHQGEGQLAAVAPTGVMSEQVPIATDGRFSFTLLHAPPEYLVYVAKNRPLAVLQIPSEMTDDVSLSLPTAVARSFEVSAATDQTKSGWVGIWIGGAYVPLQIFAIHQDWRGHDVRIDRGRSLQIVDIAETAPISIAFAPDTPSSGPFVDMFTLPQYASAHRVVATSAHVTIEP